MGRAERVRLTRRDMLKLSAGGAGMFALTASGLAVPRGFGKGGSLYIEAFPTSPLILSPFNDALPVPTAVEPVVGAAHQHEDVGEVDLAVVQGHHGSCDAAPHVEAFDASAPGGLVVGG